MGSVHRAAGCKALPFLVRLLSSQRTTAFKKGSAYLERYTMLIVFAFYLEHVGPETGEPSGRGGEGRGRGRGRGKG